MRLLDNIILSLLLLFGYQVRTSKEDLIATTSTSSKIPAESHVALSAVSVKESHQPSPRSGNR